MRRETIYRRESDLVAGEFRSGRSYRNWRPRGSGDWLLIYTVGGAGRITTATGDFTTQPGEVIVYAPDDLQDYKTDVAVGQWHLLWSHFTPRPGWYAWLAWPKNAVGLRHIHLPKGDVRDAFAAALARTLRTYRRRLSNSADFAANALEEALLWAHLAASRGDWMRTDPRVRKAMDYLAANVRQPVRLEALARHCGLSVSRLAHLFKDESGVSPQHFFEQQRMRQATQMLRMTGFGIAEIAAEVGYDDPFYFTNRFRRHTGKSPTQYRQRANSV